MSVAKILHLPREIFLTILEVAAARFRWGYINDPEPEHNAVLVVCALVCRAWRGPAQRMLFSDITLGRTFYHDRSDKMRVIGSTGRALKSLVEVLKSFKESENALRHQIRSIHLVVGLTLYYRKGQSLTQDVDWQVREPSPGAIIRAITLCPQLIHLNLSIGVVPMSRPRSSDFLFRVSLNLLAAEKPPHLRQLRVTSGTGNTLSVLDAFDLVDERPACEILSVLAPSLTVLDYGICLDFHDLSPPPPPLPPLPVLHTLYTESGMLRSAIYTQAPALRKASIPVSLRVRNFIPAHVEELILYHPNDDVSRFHRLKTLALANFASSGLESESQRRRHVLRTLPPSLEHLVLSTVSDSAEYERTKMEMTAAAVRGLPDFKSLILAPRSHEELAPERLEHFASYGIPIEISYTYWRKMFPRAD